MAFRVFLVLAVLSFSPLEPSFFHPTLSFSALPKPLHSFPLHLLFVVSYRGMWLKNKIVDGRLAQQILWLGCTQHFPPHTDLVEFLKNRQMSASLSPAGELSDAIRATPEYAAAVNLEVWAAAKKETFLADLERIRQRKLAELEENFQAKDAARLAEIDSLREELETMALRLQQTGTLLQKKIVAFEKRESAFEARRLDASKRTEELMTEAEQRNRRLVEEGRVARDGLQSQLREKELELQQTLQRLTLAQQEFDALQRFTARIQSRDSEDRTRQSQLEHQLSAASSHMRSQQQEVEFQRRRIAELESTNSELQRACSFYKSELASLTERFNLLNETTHRQQSALILQEKKEVENMSRRQQIADEQTCGSMTANVTCADVLASIATRRARDGSQQVRLEQENRRVASASSASFKASLNPSLHPVSEIEDLRRLVVGLVEQSKADERLARRALRRRQRQASESNRGGATRESAVVVYAEQAPIASGSLKSSAGASKTAPRQASEAQAAEVELSSLSSGRDREDNRADDCSDGSEKDDTTRAGASDFLQRRDEPPSANSSTVYERIDDDPAASHRQSWLHSNTVRADNEDDDDLERVDDDEAIERILARHRGLDNERRVPEEGASIAVNDHDGQHSSNDIAHFVTLLKANRAKLIATGVYSERDSLIEEMDRKIDMYERWCRQLY